MIKKKIGAVVIVAGLVITSILGVMSFTTIRAGYVGIVYSVNGGVKDKICLILGSGGTYKTASYVLKKNGGKKV